MIRGFIKSVFVNLLGGLITCTWQEKKLSLNI
jgi:hypothetical protein